MLPTLTANTYAGEVTVRLGGAPRRLRFGMNTLRDYTALTGSPAGNFGLDFQTDYNAALLHIVYCAIKRYTPADELPEGFGLDAVGDWLDELAPEDADRLAATLIASVKTVNPLVAAVVKQVAPPPQP